MIGKATVSLNLAKYLIFNGSNMDTLHRNIGKPAPFSNSAATEMTAVELLESLFDRRRIKGKIQVQDKTPNTDGLLTINDAFQFPIAHVDVQVKTLRPSNARKPRYQCERELFAYADTFALPVILIVVDIANRKAYWRHIDQALIAEVNDHIKGKTYATQIPMENCIDGKNDSYLSLWTALFDEVKSRIDNYDLVVRQNLALSHHLGELGKNFQPAYSLSGQDIKEVHIFLDHLNSLLDREFKAIKDILYFNYWKIGIGIGSYTADRVSFVLYPHPYTNNSVLIKEIRKDARIDFMTLYQEDGALVMSSNHESNSVRTDPYHSAMRLVEKEVFKVVGKSRFQVKNEHLASEYLLAFLDTFSTFFGLDQPLTEINIDELKTLLFITMPAVIELNTNYIAPGLSDYTVSIDSYKDLPVKPFYKQRIAAAQVEIAAGYLPKVVSGLSSQLFQLDLIVAYIRFLEEQGKTVIARPYQLGQVVHRPGRWVWASWNKTVLDQNLQLFFQNFPAVYAQLTNQQFPLLKETLSLYQDNDLLVFVLWFDLKPNPDKKPCLQYFRLKADKLVQKQVLYFSLEDPACPLDLLKVYDQRPQSVEIKDITYKIQMMGTHPVQFMFDKSPTYTFMEEILKERLKEYFK